MAGIGGWVVESAIRYSTNGISVMERLSVATDQAAIAEGRLTRNITAQEAAWMRLRATQEKTYARYRELTMGIAGSVAVVGAASIGYVADQAAKLQQILQTIKNETGATAGQIRNIYNDVFAIGNQSGMSPIQSGEIWRTVSRMTAGQMTIAQMRAIAPSVADFASVIHFNRPDIDVNQAALTGLSTAHLFRAYNAQKLNPLLDKVYRLSGLMGETPDQALRQMSYYVPMFKGLGINDDTSLAMMALLDRAGFRNKVGTNVRAMVLQSLGPLQLTRHAQAGKLTMLEQMGIFRDGKFAFDNPDGSMNFMGVLSQLAKWEHIQRARGVSQSTLDKELFGVFGKQGGTIATLMSDPAMVAFLGQIRAYFGNSDVSLGAGKKNRDDSLTYQFGRAVGNLRAVLVELGYPWLKDLTNFFKSIADNLHNWQQWLHQHKDTEKAIGGIFAAVTSFAAYVVSVGAISRAMQFVGILTEMPNALRVAVAPLRWLVSGLWAISTGGAAASTGISAVGAAIRGWTLAGAAFLASPFGLFIAALIGFTAATTTTAGKGEFKEGDRYWLNYGRHNGWYAMPKTVRNQLFGEGYRPNTSHHDDRNIINIHGPINITTNADSVKKLADEVRGRVQSVLRSQGAIKTHPTMTPPSGHWLPAH